ncbi:MAG TPA: hypothetical protein VJA26_17155, partial [Gammaproteobacteria bacterium]|nr:hypothetical protein [Gammaproteobacteria bacterium]
LVLAYLIGAVVYDRRVILGVYAPRSPEAKLEAEYHRLLRERRGILDHAYGIAAGGNVKGALAHINDHAKSEGEPLSAKVWMFHQMVRWEDGRAALELGKDLAAELGAADRHDEAAKVLVACRFVEDRRKRVPGAG